MIFSRRRPGPDDDRVPIVLQAAEQKTPTIALRSLEIPETIDARRRRTDTDGARRRARQTKQDNELL